TGVQTCALPIYTAADGRLTCEGVGGRNIRIGAVIVIQHRPLRAFKKNAAAVLLRLIKAAPDDIGKLQHIRRDFHKLGVQRIAVHFRGAEAAAKRVVMVEQRFRSEEHTSELQSRENLVCRLLLEKKKKQKI